MGGSFETWRRGLDEALVISMKPPFGFNEDSQMQRIYQHKLRDNNSGSLKIYGLPTIILQIVHPQHSLVHLLRYLGEQPFEVCEERGVIESPF